MFPKTRSDDSENCEVSGVGCGRTKDIGSGDHGPVWVHTETYRLTSVVGRSRFNGCSLCRKPTSEHGRVKCRNKETPRVTFGYKKYITESNSASILSVFVTRLITRTVFLVRGPQRLRIRRKMKGRLGSSTKWRHPETKT